MEGILLAQNSSGCSEAWFIAPALGAGDPRFKSEHPDQIAMTPYRGLKQKRLRKSMEVC